MIKTISNKPKAWFSEPDQTGRSGRENQEPMKTGFF